MPTLIWIVLVGTVIVVLVVALLVVRGLHRRRPVDVDRSRHQAALDAERSREQRSSVSDIGLWQI